MADAQAKKALASMTASMTSVRQIFLPLTGTLFIDVISASNLKACDMNGFSVSQQILFQQQDLVTIALFNLSSRKFISFTMTINFRILS